MFKKGTPAEELCKSVKSLIGSIKQAPHYVLDNEYIHSGYRIGFNTTCKILESLFMLHNESVNVWSHLFGVFIFLIFIIYTAIKLGPRIDSDIHIRIMDQFNTLYQMADNITSCETEDIEAVAQGLLRIYEEDIPVNNFNCNSNPFFVLNDKNQLTCSLHEDQPELSLFDLSMESYNPTEFDQKIDYLLDKVETYIHTIVNGMQKLSKKIR